MVNLGYPSSVVGSYAVTCIQVIYYTQGDWDGIEVKRTSKLYKT